MKALVATDHGVYVVDVEAEEVVAHGGPAPERPPFAADLPLVVAGDTVGATRIAVVARRPPLMVSHDAGATWRESGGGLPAGRDVALHPENPDLVLYAARNRLFLSRDGGRFWRALAPELPEIDRVGWADA